MVRPRLPLGKRELGLQGDRRTCCDSLSEAPRRGSYELMGDCGGEGRGYQLRRVHGPGSGRERGVSGRSKSIQRAGPTWAGVMSWGLGKNGGVKLYTGEMELNPLFPFGASRACFNRKDREPRPLPDVT